MLPFQRTHVFLIVAFAAVLKFFHRMAGKLAPVTVEICVGGIALCFLWATFWPRHSEMETYPRTPQQISALRTALNAYSVDCDALPDPKIGFHALITNPGVAGWRGPYLDVRNQATTSFLLDEWGMPFRYERRGERPAVISAGPDKRFGTGDDLGVMK